MPAPYRRIDHVIAEVPHIHLAHEALLKRGFAEAWPIGRYWPLGLTCGVALGGLNLELLQPDHGRDVRFGGETPPEGTARTTEPLLTTVVYTPTSIAEASATGGHVSEKREADPDKLALRGFPPELRGTEQSICTNIFVPGERYFLCAYTPYLAVRLDPDVFPQPFGKVEAVRIPHEAPDPVEGPRRESGDDGFVFSERGYVPLADLLL